MLPVGTSKRNNKRRVSQTTPPPFRLSTLTLSPTRTSRPPARLLSHTPCFSPAPTIPYTHTGFRRSGCVGSVCTDTIKLRAASATIKLRWSPPQTSVSFVVPFRTRSTAVAVARRISFCDDYALERFYDVSPPTTYSAEDLVLRTIVVGSISVLDSDVW